MKDRKSKPVPALPLFVYFFTVNLLVAFGPFSLGTEGIVLLAGIAIPLFFLLWKTPSQSSSLPAIEIPVFTLSKWILFLLAAFALFVRFYRLVSFARWPVFDEATLVYLGMDLARNMDFHMFYSCSQNPPLPVWAVALVFKLFGPSLFSFWLVPALLSALTLFLVFLTVRKFLKPAPAGAFTALWAFGFWPLYAGRFSSQIPVLVFWLWLALYALGRWTHSSTKSAKSFNLLLFSAITGSGFYSTINNWGFIFLALSTAFAYYSRKQWKSIFTYAVVVSAVLLPLILSILDHQYGFYVHHLWAFQGGFSLADYLLNVFNYVRGLFWGVSKTDAIPSYGPYGGGLLNPLLGAFFFVGLIEAWKSRRSVGFKLLIGILLIVLAPAPLTNSTEFFRIFPCLIPLLFITLVGLGRLLKELPSRQGIFILLGLLLVSSGFDLYRLFVPTAQAQVSEAAWFSKSGYRYEAYQILDQLQRQEGPGLVFDKFQSLTYLDFTARYSDPSLSIASYPFNALENPGIPLKDTRWAAILCDSPFQSFLSRSFPRAQWIRLSFIPGRGEGEEFLGILQQPQDHSKIISRWIKADRAYRQVVIAMLNHAYGKPNDDIWEAFLAAYPSVRGDPFLEAAFWLKFARLGEEDAGRYLAQNNLLEHLRPAIRPFPFLNQHLGKIYYFAGEDFYKAGNYTGAWQAFTQAGVYDPSLKMPEEFKRKLEGLRRTTTGKS